MSARDEVLGRYELVVGMEVHAQLNTRTKLFCGCKLEFAAAPNTRTCPVCLGLPGTLPVVNAEAFEKVLRIAVAFGSHVEATTEFDRKNYYYPDQPKNYQISQMYHNVGGGDERPGGELVLLRSGKAIGIHNVHLEEDAGKLSHVEGRGTSSVDLNRAGTPLAEIVTQPDFRSVEEVDDYMDTLTELLRALDVCGCQMQEGNLRFEASVSVRPRGQEALGARTEIKNLNSYSAVRKAVSFEQARQIALLEAGQVPRQETRLWDEGWDPSDRVDRQAFEQGVPDALRPDLELVLSLLPDGKDEWKGRTSFMRSKEDAHDYRYFPEPDLPALAIDPERLERLRRELPELPGPRRKRYVEGLGLAQKPAEVLTRDLALAAYFEEVCAQGVPAPDAANYVLNQVTAVLNARKLSAAARPVPVEHVVELHALIAEAKLPKDLVLKQVWPKTVDEGLSPRAVVAKYQVEAVDESAVEAATDQAWAENPQAVQDLLAGKKKALGAIVGAVMRTMKGKASPQVINARIEALLERERERG